MPFARDPPRELLFHCETRTEILSKLPHPVYRMGHIERSNRALTRVESNKGRDESFGRKQEKWIGMCDFPDSYLGMLIRNILHFRLPLAIRSA